ncbi:MFS transporter [Buchnera aphidicola (Chaitoregma tattakana)]|uniref:MFS transporter n=1 Tax=Buchnera aphidicola TaxID=9 RepID=UPI0031B883C2
MKNNIYNNKSNVKVILVILTIFFLRNIGLFFIFPIFNFCNINLYGSTKFLNSLCLSIYGIFQIIFQIPFGFLSNSFGKKNTIIISLFIFFIGNLICFFSNSVFGVLLGRSLQGIGSVSSILIDVLIDHTSKKSYVFSIFLVGITFGITFFISMSSSLFIFNKIGLKNIFLIILTLSLFLIFFSYFYIPKDKKQDLHKKKTFIKINLLLEYFKNKNYVCVLKYTFISNFIFSSNFYIFPKIFSSFFINYNTCFKIYFYTFFFSSLISLILACFLRSNIENNRMYIFLFVFFLFSETIFLFNNKYEKLFFLGLQIFFLIFNLLSSFLPILFRKVFYNIYGCRDVPISIYTTMQLLGMSLGSVFSGILCTFLNFKILFFICIILIFFCINIYKQNFKEDSL